MPISTLNRRAGPYAGNGATTTFAFAFRVTAPADVRVILMNSAGVETDQVLLVNYTVILNADQDAAPGGSVVMNVPPPPGVSLFIGSQIPATQLADLNNAGGFYPRVVTDALDRLTMLFQQSVEQLARAALSPFSEHPTNLIWPRVSDRANRLLAFDSQGRMVPGANAAAVALASQNIQPTGLPGQNVAQNFAEMASLLKSGLVDGVTVVAVGGLVRGDGLGGVFWWDETSTDPDDGMNVIESAEGGPGRWRRAAFAGSNVFVDLFVTDTATIQTLSVAGSTTLGAVTASALTVTGNASTPSVLVVSASVTTLNCQNSNVFRVAMVSDISTLNVVNPADGQTINIRFIQDGTGGRTVAWPGSFLWPDGAPLALSTDPNRVDLMVATWFADTSTWLVSLVKHFT